MGICWEDGQPDRDRAERSEEAKNGPGGKRARFCFCGVSGERRRLLVLLRSSRRVDRIPMDVVRFQSPMSVLRRQCEQSTLQP
jgi:hypothetical protein